jgi:hypothetical protein
MKNWSAIFRLTTAEQRVVLALLLALGAMMTIKTCQQLPPSASPSDQLPLSPGTGP